MKFRIEKQNRKSGIYYNYRADYRLPGERKTKRVYLGKQDQAERYLEDFNSKKPDEEYLMDYSGPLLLYKIAQTLNFEKIIDQEVSKPLKYSIGSLILLVTITRVFYPNSKYLLAKERLLQSYLTEQLHFDASEMTHNVIYTYMDYIFPNINKIHSKLIKNAIKEFDISLDELIIDATSYSCHGNDPKEDDPKEDDQVPDFVLLMSENKSNGEVSEDNQAEKKPIKRLKGYNREKRKDLSQINFMLGVNNQYVPLYFETFAGNTADVKMFAYTLKKLKREYSFLFEKCKKKYMVFDRGNWNQENSDYLHALCEEYKLFFVSGLRFSHVKDEALAWIPTDKDIINKNKSRTILGYSFEKKIYNRLNKVLLYSSPVIERKKLRLLDEKLKTVDSEILKLKNDTSKSKDELYINYKSLLKKYGVSRLYDLNKTKSKKKIQVQCSPNKEKIDQKKKLLGKFALFTNRLELSSEDIFRIYLSDHIVEQSFHLSRHLFDASTIFHYLPDRIETHLAIVSWGFLLLSLLRFKLAEAGYNESFEQLIRKINAGKLSASVYKYPETKKFLIKKIQYVDEELTSFLKILKIPQDYFYITDKF